MNLLTTPAFVFMLFAVLLGGCSENDQPGGATPAESAQSQSASNKQLFQAALDGHLVQLRLLLGRGVPVDAHNAEGRTPLMLAAEAGHVGAVRFLLESGANVNALSPQNGTALMFAASGGHTAAT
ncbi:MAG: ankyrin repeat domain-containing protein, partial [Gammaproteobacteria bacterium]